MFKQRIAISDEKIKINLNFYFFIKCIVQSKMKKSELDSILSFCLPYRHIPSSEASMRVYDEIVEKFFARRKSADGAEKLKEVFLRIKNTEDFDLFILSLNLLSLKELLLEEAKSRSRNLQLDLSEIDPLSLEYDNATLEIPYLTRVNGALIVLSLFRKLENRETNFLTEESVEFLEKISAKLISFKARDLEANQIFMLLFNESINQSIKSESGGSYEHRIQASLISMGITDFQKKHDKNDLSTEYDFFFSIGNVRYGIGAKRTLRERYKQFVKTAIHEEVDVMIEITLGIDLTEEKARAIRQHGVYLFIAYEKYRELDYLHHIEGIYPSTQFDLETLKSLASKA